MEISVTVNQDTKYHSAKLSLSQAEFESYGFTLGDSLDLRFANGYTLTDVPYYSGYYVKMGMPVVCAYYGANRVRVTLDSIGIWDAAGLEEDMSVLIRLNTPGKYRSAEEALSQYASSDRQDYESDEQFVNFRALAGGRLRANHFYRGSSPVDNCNGRAEYADTLMRKYNIGFVLDLADNEADLAAFRAAPDFRSDYAMSLLAQGKLVLMALSAGYSNDDYRDILISGLRQLLLAEDCPVYLHCTEGKDRTGFVCLLLEALVGADYRELRRDYMLTYENFFGVSEEGSPEKYKAIAGIYFSSFLEFLHGFEDPEADYAADAVAYLRAGGMSEEEIEALRARLEGNS